MKHNADGSLQKKTILANNTQGVGFTASDGSVNVVIDDVGGSGCYHKTGALRMNSASNTSVYDPSGAFYSNHILGNPRG